MSSIEEITALRQELADRQAERRAREIEAVDERRAVELANEADKLKAQIAEEETVAALLAGAGQVEEVKVGRTDEEILTAAAAADAIANGASQEEVNARIAEAKVDESQDKVVAPKPEPKFAPASTAASKEEEK